MSGVLNIRDARRRLPELVRSAARAGEEVRLGSHGLNEATLISSARLDALRGELAELRRCVGVQAVSDMEDRPFAELEVALAEGRIGVPIDPTARRLIRGYRPESDLSWDEMATLGNAGQREPHYRRLPLRGR